MHERYLISNLPYDPKNKDSVLSYAQQLVGHSLSEFGECVSDDEKKGDFGQLLEEAYFYLKNNNTPDPDLECGIEIKTGNLVVRPRAGIRVKERVKISTINYGDSFNDASLKESSLWRKIEHVLLMLFMKRVDEQGKWIAREHEKCHFADLLEWSEDEVRQLSEDWLTIKKLVVAGRADELSDGLTWYLGANTGSTGKLVNAPGDVLAKQRDFSFKNAFVNYKLGHTKLVRGSKARGIQPKWANVKKQLIKLSSTSKKPLEQYISDELNLYAGRNSGEICSELGKNNLFVENAKDNNSKLAKLLLKAILAKDVVLKKGGDVEFEQLEKAGIILKAICLEDDGRLVESVSFPAFRWTELADEHANKTSWEYSELYEQISSRFLFVVFKKQTKSKERNFFRAFFWSMPPSDLERMKTLWIDTAHKIDAGKYGDFLRKTQHEIGHVRPHAKNKKDTFPTPQGGNETKRSFWLNNDYIKNVVDEHVSSEPAP